MQDNLKEKYGITDEELKRRLTKYNSGKSLAMVLCLLRFVIWFATAIYNRQKKSKPTNEPL